MRYFLSYDRVGHHWGPFSDLWGGRLSPWTGYPGKLSGIHSALSEKNLTSLLQSKITKETHVRLVIHLSFILQVPFDFIDFSKDFLEGKIDLEETSEEDEV